MMTVLRHVLAGVLIISGCLLLGEWSLVKFGGVVLIAMGVNVQVMK